MEFKLSYFPAKGRGEIIRLLFAVADVEFEDERIPHDKWPEFKPKTPMQSMPVLSVPGRPMVCQTGAIARYLAKKFGFYGSNPWEELMIDESVDVVADVLVQLSKQFYEKDEDKKAELKNAFKDEVLPKFVSYIRLRMKEGQNGYIIGSKLSLTDLSIFNIINQMKEANEPLFDSFDDLIVHYEKIKSNPRIAAWLEKRPA